MEKLVSSWYNNVQPLPETYIFPPDARPGKLSTLPSSDNIPVINLGGGGAEGHDRTRIVEQILGASQEFGFFQVINHGISENLLHDTMDVFREFFALPPEDKASFFSEDPNKLCRLITSTGNYDRENVHLWRDALRHPCHALEKFIPLWPQQPLKYREHVDKCSTQVRKVALNILDSISEGLGIGYGHFSDELSQETLLSVNHYPPCPDPSLTLGITKHCDPNLITILLQGDVHGLQVFKDGKWIGVDRGGGK
ncbi:flavanone 3-dioxygenase 2 [Rosa chinensis]|uniref:flavanone 3-dioxygenase 2 n=1 Tax=Rosa chinensis TaxID=74649 RepID=UPI001AD90EEA|nr:flavanone 3-dioxygenase 2 [Rosa chinensis]